jgi:hypothetical protein
MEMPMFDDDLNPRRFVQKHLLSGLNRDDPDGTEASGKTPATASLPAGRLPSTPKPRSAGAGGRHSRHEHQLLLYARLTVPR